MSPPDGLEDPTTAMISPSNMSLRLNTDEASFQDLRLQDVTAKASEALLPDVNVINSFD
jgi:hypothetical protein